MPVVSQLVFRASAAPDPRCRSCGFGCPLYLHDLVVIQALPFTSHRLSTPVLFGYDSTFIDSGSRTIHQTSNLNLLWAVATSGLGTSSFGARPVPLPFTAERDDARNDTNYFAGVILLVTRPAEVISISGNFRHAWRFGNCSPPNLSDLDV